MNTDENIIDISQFDEMSSSQFMSYIAIYVRKYLLNVSQRKFEKIIGLTQAEISRIESGKITFPKQNNSIKILTIC